jgi:hypothetical protein
MSEMHRASQKLALGKRRFNPLTIAALCMFCVFFASGCGLMTIRALDDSTGMPIQDAEITFAAQTGQDKLLGKTGHSGEALIKTDPSQAGTITVSKDGYTPFSSPLDRLPVDNTDLTVEVRLVPIGQEPTPKFPSQIDDSAFK